MCKQNNVEKPPEDWVGFFPYALYLFTYVNRSVNILVVFPCYPSIQWFFSMLYPHRELDPNFFSVQNLSLFVFRFCPFSVNVFLSPCNSASAFCLPLSHSCFIFVLVIHCDYIKFLFIMLWTKDHGSSKAPCAITGGDHSESSVYCCFLLAERLFENSWFLSDGFKERHHKIL